MKKASSLLLSLVLIAIFLCLLSNTFSNTVVRCSNFSNSREYYNAVTYDFKKGDIVIFKKNEQGNLLEGKITEINQNIAVIEYIDPDEPAKLKEIMMEFDKLTKVEKVDGKNDLELNMRIIFKKENNERLWDGIITGINKTTAVIEYSNPDEPSKVKEYVSDFGRMYKISKTVAKVINNEVKIEEKPEIKSEFKVGDLVKFKKLSSGEKFEGKIITITLNIAEVEYKDPAQPSKIKSIELNLKDLSKIDRTFKVGDYVRFKKLNSSNEFEGKIVAIRNSIAEVEYKDPADPSKIKSIEKEISELTIIDNPAPKQNQDIKTEKIKVINPDFKQGDKVYFTLSDYPRPITGLVVATFQNTMLVSYINSRKGGRKTEVEIEYSSVIKKIKSYNNKIEKEKTDTNSNKVKVKPVTKITKEKVKPDSSENKNKIPLSYLHHTIAVDGLQFAFKRASIWYEYKPTELIGIRIPVYINWSDLIYSLGVNPKFYFNRNSIIQGFAGPSIIGSIQPHETTSKTIFYLDFLGDVGISINPIRNFNITVNCGAGLNINMGQVNTTAKFSYYPEVSVGYNF